MKTNLHPEYHEVLVHCACGETWTTRSTKKELRIEICSKCHPFFTGKQKLVDSAGRVERFRKRYEKKAAAPLPRACRLPPRLPSLHRSLAALARRSPGALRARGSTAET